MDTQRGLAEGDVVATATSYRSWTVHAAQLAPVPDRPQDGLVPQRPLCDIAPTNVRKHGMSVTCLKCLEILDSGGLSLVAEGWTPAPAFPST